MRLNEVQEGYSDKINSIIKRIVDILVEKYHPVKIILFGSYALGNYTEDSDIDILIIKETDEKRRVDRFIEVKRLIYDSENEIPVSPLVLTIEEIKERLKMGDNFIEEILEKGKVLYEREDN